MQGFGNRMRRAMDEAGLTESALSLRLGINKRTLNHYLNDNAEPKLQTLVDFCEIIGVPVDQLLNMDDSENASQLVLDPATMEPVEMLDQTEEGPADETRKQPETFRQIAFRSDWLNRLGIKASEAALVTVSGNQMQPTLNAGDVVMIDKRHTDVSVSRGVYACRLGGNLTVARIAYHLKQKMYVVERDNYDVATEFHDQVKPGAFEVLGKVVWVSKVWTGDRY